MRILGKIFEVKKKVSESPPPPPISFSGLVRLSRLAAAVARHFAPPPPPPPPKLRKHPGATPACNFILEAILGWFNNVSWSEEVPWYQSHIYNKKRVRCASKSWIYLQHIRSNRRLHCSDDGKGSLFECCKSSSMYNLSRQGIPHTNCPRGGGKKGEFVYI